MIIPVRCPSCGKVLADKWEYFKKKSEEIDQSTKDAPKDPKFKYFDKNVKKELLDELGLKKICCRRTFIGQVDILDEM